MRRLDKTQLHEALLDARQYTSALVEDLSDAQWAAEIPLLPIVNPFLWEVGHVGWFMEHWCLRWQGAERPLRRSLLADADRWYNSSTVPHDVRWSLDLPSRSATLRYLDDVLQATLEQLAGEPNEDAALYKYRLCLYHEDMHGEAFAYMRHTLGYPAPAIGVADEEAGAGGDVALAGGRFEQGAPRDGGFVFDNEKWAHPVEVAPFVVARAPVSVEQYLAFVEDGGYAREALWSEAGRAWLCASGRRAPRDWHRDEGVWLERRYRCWETLPLQAPVRHVTAFEAEAYCRWARRRLPSESEWEFAALAGAIAPQGVWEWTASAFAPYPGFSADRYADYSLPWFGTHRCVRGASWATPLRLWHPKFRNFYLPERDDIFVGFRTCVLD